MSRKSVSQECPLRVSHKSVPQQCPTRVSYKSVPQELPTTVSHKSAPQECPTRVSYRSIPQECPTRVSHKSFHRVSHKSVPQECPTRVSRKSVPQEFPTRRSDAAIVDFSVLCGWLSFSSAYFRDFGTMPLFLSCRGSARTFTSVLDLNAKQRSFMMKTELGGEVPSACCLGGGVPSTRCPTACHSCKKRLSPAVFLSVHSGLTESDSSKKNPPAYMSLTA